ncbi:hypothetical protein DPMN_138426 [Dreissena polymorpha]|uniref:Uncharacterized protein n=1 Tax=Dreissena polymorpha TaxID=45954 RepID=A0A9D4G6M7_DREPO|nr:hypothetical protein DPMN_138426 [Dreissena polymorpha]
MLKKGVILLVLYSTTLAQVRADGKQTLLPGNFTMAPAMYIFEPVAGGTCGHKADVRSMQLLEAMKWYLQRINENGGLPFKIATNIFLIIGQSRNNGCPRSFSNLTYNAHSVTTTVFVNSKGFHHAILF